MVPLRRFVAVQLTPLDCFCALAPLRSASRGERVGYPVSLVVVKRLHCEPLRALRPALDELLYCIHNKHTIQLGNWNVKHNVFFLLEQLK